MRTEATGELLTRPLPINPSPPQSTWLRGGTWLAWVTAGEGGRNVQEQRRSQPPSGAQSGRGGWSWAWGCTAALPGPRRPTFHPDTCSGTSASPQFPVCAPYTGSFKNANLTASFSARPTKPPRRLLTTLRRTPSPPLPPRGPLHTDARLPPALRPRGLCTCCSPPFSTWFVASASSFGPGPTQQAPPLPEGPREVSRGGVRAWRGQGAQGSAAGDKSD